MSIKIKNGLVNDVIEFVEELELKGKESRHRTYFKQGLQEVLEDIAKDEAELVKSHLKEDVEEGKEQINYVDLKDPDKFLEEQREFLNESYEVKFKNTATLDVIKSVIKKVDEGEIDIELKGRKADVYTELYEVLVGE